MFLKDSKTQGIQYSKLLVILCLLIAIIGVGVTIWACAVYYLAETVASAIVGVCGSLAITAVVWMLKKSQAENTIKIYMSAYEELTKPPSGTLESEDVVLIQQQMKEKLISGVNNAIDIALEESTSPIEKHEI